MNQPAQNTGISIQMIDRRRASQRGGRQTNKPKKFKTLVIRMPTELAEKIDLFSRASWRTLTAEVVRRLEDSFENQSIDEHGVIVAHSPMPLK